MHFDLTNETVKLCAAGMQLEGAGKTDEAAAHFRQAWNSAGSNMEKFIAAHYVARHQSTLQEKLEWDQIALAHALQIADDNIKSMLPSLYLNIAKGHEDLHDDVKALENYQLALSFTQHLADDGYGNMIKAGIKKGLDRTSPV